MAKARPSSTDIDRFLEEVNRRKQQQARQTTPPPQPIQRTSPKPATATPPPPKMAKVQQKQVMTSSEPIVRAVILEATPEPTVSRDYATKTTFQPPTPQALPRNVDSGAVYQVKSMLKSKEGLRAMFVMNEILSPPLSRRPRSR